MILLKHMTKRILHIASSLCLIALALLSWTPLVHEMRTGFASQIEHVIAYAGTALLATLAFGPRNGFGTIAPLLIIYSAILESAKAGIVGRHPKLIDFFADTAGTLAGCLTASVMLLLARAILKANPTIWRKP